MSQKLPGWVDQDSAKKTAQTKLDEIFAAIQKRTATTTSYEDVAEAIRGGNEAMRNLLCDPFYCSVGIAFPDDPYDGETLYLSSAPVGAHASTLDVYPWTHWLGGVFTQLREAYERGEERLTVECGPPGRHFESPAGPLTLYQLKERAVTAAEILTLEETEPLEKDSQVSTGDDTVAEDHDASESDEEIELDDEFDEFRDQSVTDGLKSIAETFDVEQDHVVRGPCDGAFLITGGPGTGKTSIALHRIPYLIWVAQQPNEDTGVSVPQDFFTVDKTMILVWKPHLTGYLRDCVDQLIGVPFPQSNVRHVDEWVTGLLNQYVNLAGSGWQLAESDRELDKLKRRLTEHEVADFLRSDHPFRDQAEAAFREKLPAGLSAGLTQRFDELRRLERASLAVGRVGFSVAGFYEAAKRIRSGIGLPGKPFSQQQNSEIRSIRRSTQDALTAGLKFVSNYRELLFAFYESDIAVDRMTRAKRDVYKQKIAEQKAAKRLTKYDTYMLLWLVHLITEGGDASRKNLQPLPTMTHIVVDEAQYYEPLLLRLLSEVVDLPKGVLTVVGDVEQRFGQDGGINDWSEAGLTFDHTRVHHLEANYRWTERLFDFLTLYHREANIREPLQRPYKFRVGGGIRPELAIASSRADEIEAVAARIGDLKCEDRSSDWTVAIIVPEKLEEELRSTLQAALSERFIQAVWPAAADVHPTTNHAVITTYGNVVGLEFDAVFCLAVDAGLSRNTIDTRQALWVALTRARRFLYVSEGGRKRSRIFAHEDFESYIREWDQDGHVEDVSNHESDGGDLPEDSPEIPKSEPVDHDSVGGISSNIEVAEPPAELLARMTSQLWFALSKWGKETEALNPGERRFSYSQGIRESKGNPPSEKQASWAKSILKKAKAAGFDFDSAE